MFLVGELGATIGADRKPFNKVLDSVFRDGGRQMAALGSKMTAALTLPLVGAGALAVKTAADYETLRTSMDILNGSVEEGGRNFERLKEFSARTPFQLNDLASAQNMLQGFGLEADHAFNSLSMIGDVAAATGSDVSSIARVFGKSAAEGRLMTEEILQLVDNGVPAFKLLADTMGVPQSEIRKLAETGKISFDILQQSFRNATSEGGIYADGMEKQSKTISGLFSTLKDNVSLALGGVGQSLVDAFDLKGLIGDLTGYIQSAIGWFDNLSKEAQKDLFMIAGGIAALGPALIGIGVTVTALGAAFAALTSPITLAIGAVAGLAAGVLYVADNWDAIKERISDIGWWRNMVVDMLRLLNEFFVRAFDGFNSLIKMVGGSGFANPFGAIEQGLVSLRGEQKQYETEFGSFTDAVLNGFNKITGIDFRNMFTPASNEVREFGKSIEKAALPVREISTDFINLETVAVPAMNRTWSATNELSSGLMFAQQIADDFTNSFGQGMANVFVESEKVLGTIKNIGKLLASAFIQKGISALLTGGLSGAGFFGDGGGLFGKIFGGFRANGGDVMAGRSYVVGENGREIFSPSTNGSITPVRSGFSGPKKVQVNISGVLTGQGSELRAVINESHFIDLE